MKIGNNKNSSSSILEAVGSSIKNSELYFLRDDDLNRTLTSLQTIKTYGVIENGSNSDLYIFDFDDRMEIIESTGDVKRSINAYYEDSDLNNFTVTPATGVAVTPRNLNMNDINKIPDVVIRNGVTVTGLTGVSDFTLTASIMIKTTQSQSQNITAANASFFENGRYLVIPKGKKLLIENEIVNELNSTVTINLLGRMFFAKPD